jgi:hypothetical protein
MPLPQGFDDWEHLQTVLMQVHNRIVRDEFNDVGAEDWDDDITTPRGSLRVACTIKDRDSILMVLSRFFLFYVLLRKARDFHPAIYALTNSGQQTETKFLPEVKLFFVQDPQSVTDGDDPVEAVVSYRLVNETGSTMNESKARAIANEIRTTFAAGSGYTWKKGKVCVNYQRGEQGYHCQVWAYSEAEAREVLQKLLSLNEHSLDDDYLRVTTPKKSNVAPRKTKLLYGKQRKIARYRPNVTVRFQYAALHISGMPNDIILCDRTGYWREALVRA